MKMFGRISSCSQSPTLPRRTSYSFQSMSILLFLLCFIICGVPVWTSPATKTVHHHARVYTSPKDTEELVNPSQLTFRLNEFCNADVSLEKVVCVGVKFVSDLPTSEAYFVEIQQAVFVNVSGDGDLTLEHLAQLFPRLILLSINQSPASARSLINPLDSLKRLNVTAQQGQEKKRQGTLVNSIQPSNETRHRRSISGSKETASTYATSIEDGFAWESVRMLNLSWNELKSQSIPEDLMDIFPNLEQLDLSNNFISSLAHIPSDHWTQLKTIDLSGNPLDCTRDMDWLENPGIEVLHPNHTLCDLPPHQNKAKPIFKVIRLIKKVKAECRVNCSCDIAYIWEQNHVIHSKTAVNCSARGFSDFPDPDKLPQPTDTLDLSHNHISSMRRFVEDERYADLHVMNLYLDNNQISSMNSLEGSDWFYNFQVFTLRQNNLTEVPVYVLENVLRQNKRILHIDLSLNDFRCDCVTVSTFKVWLLRYSPNVKHIDEVLCSGTKEQIRYMKKEDWCTVDEGTRLIEILDLVSIILAILIVAVIAKVYYDYYNFKRHGKLPWIVSKM